jgi:hypothetical protein
LPFLGVALRHLLHFPKKWISAFKSNLEPIDFVFTTSQTMALRQIAKIIGRNACRRVASCERCVFLRRALPDS